MDIVTLALIMVGFWLVTQAMDNGASSSIPGVPVPSGGSSLISQIVANLESGGGLLAAQQPSSMADPVYGQYAAFVNQYGSGAAGVDNYAALVLQHNPQATLGEFYSSYVLSTGNPAHLANTSDLAAQYPSAYNNLVNNAGMSPDTPLASLV